MRRWTITKDNLDNQRNAVQEERRLRVDNQPYGQTLRDASTSWPTTTPPTSTR